MWAEKDAGHRPIREAGQAAGPGKESRACFRCSQQVGARSDGGFRNWPLTAQMDGHPAARRDWQVLGLGLSSSRTWYKRRLPFLCEYLKYAAKANKEGSRLYDHLEGQFWFSFRLLSPLFSQPGSPARKRPYPQGDTQASLPHPPAQGVQWKTHIGKYFKPGARI